MMLTPFPKVCQNKRMSKQDIATIVLYVAATVVLLIQSVTSLHQSEYLNAAVYGVLGIASVFVTHFKIIKFRSLASK